MSSYLVAKRGLIVPSVPRGDPGNWGREHDSVRIECLLSVVKYKMLCFAKETVERMMFCTLVSHTNAHASRDTATLKVSSVFGTGGSANSII